MNTLEQQRDTVRLRVHVPGHGSGTKSPDRSRESILPNAQPRARKVVGMAFVPLRERRFVVSLVGGEAVAAPLGAFGRKVVAKCGAFVDFAELGGKGAAEVVICDI